MNTEDSDNGSKLQECIKREIEILDQLEKIHELPLSKDEKLEFENKLRSELLDIQQVIIKHNRITEQGRRELLKHAELFEKMEKNGEFDKPEEIKPKVNCSRNINTADAWMKRIRAIDEAGNAGPLKGGKGKL
jgi:uncharacterized protein YwqG